MEEGLLGPYSGWALIAMILLSATLQPSSAFGDQESSPSTWIELIRWGKEEVGVVHYERSRGDIYLDQYTGGHSLLLLIVNDVPWTEGGLRNESGQFRVHAPSGHGLIAVIQALNLRISKHHPECIDYLQLRDVESGETSPKICGNLKKEEKGLVVNGGMMMGPRVWDSPTGSIQLLYQSDKGEPSTTHDHALSFHILEIVFTAYRECDWVEEGTPWIPCANKCISSSLFCDERINCGFESDFAVDEISCQTTPTALKTIALYLGLPILVLSISLLFITFIISQIHLLKRIRNIPL